MILLKNYYVNTTSEIDVLTIIHEINATIQESGITEGAVNIIVPEPGGALAIIEPLADITEQFKEALKIFPGEGIRTKDKRKEEIDVGPRIAAAMLGNAIQIPFTKGKLVLGAREEPVLIDLEKAVKRREFYVQVIGESAGGVQAQKAGGAQR